MKALKTFILLLITGFAGAQIVYPPTGNVNGVNRYKGVLIVDSGIVIPMRDTVGFFGSKPTITVRPQDSTLYFFNGASYEKIETDLTKFVKYSDSLVRFVTPAQLRDSMIANTIDTTSLSNRINTKLNAADTFSLSNRINNKLNSADTIYLSNRIDQRMLYSDTVSLSNRINHRVLYTDSNVKYVTPTGMQAAIDANAIDTTSLSNRINSKLNISDTLILSNRINLKLNSSDTLGLSTRIDARQKYSDTSSFDATRHWVSTRGYLTAEIDGSVTNELQTLSRSGSTISLSNGGGGFHDSFARYTPVSPLVLGGTYPNYSILWNGTTDNVSEGTTNQYFTNTRARNAISASGDLSYNSSTGVMSYTLPMATPLNLGGVKVSTSGPLFINGSGGLSLDGSLIKTIIRSFSGVTFSNGYGAIYTIDTVRADNAQAGMMTQADKIKLYSSGTGSVSSVGITGSGALSFGGSPITTSGTFTTSWTGTTSQYVRGDGSLATFPTIPTVNNGTLTLATSGIATGSGSFTANQSGNSTFTVNVPSTLSSYTNDAGFINSMPTLQQVTTAGSTSNQSVTLAGTHTTNPIMTLQNNVSGTWGGSYMRFTRGNPNNYFAINNVTGTWNIPELLAYNSAATLPKMIFTAAGADNWAGNAGVIIRGQNSTLNGTMTNGTILSVRNHSTPLLDVKHDGIVTIPNLAGSGNRIVTTDASGNLSATIAAPLSGTYSVAATSITANAQVTLGTATITGASVGDIVEVTQPANALFYKARVTASNTVTIYAINPTTSSISTSAETINIRIIK